MANVIDIQGIHRIFETGAGFNHVLRGVSLTVAKGEFLAIMGPSGSGKSTLMNILGLLDTPTTGTYRLEGLDTSELSDDDLSFVRGRRIGFVFQSFNLLPRATVLRNVMLPLAYADVPRREREPRAVAALQAVNLPVDHYDHKTNELSGGQMQRVAIARALVCDPAIILADEPTGNLDSATGEMVLQTFERLRERGKTIVLITHDESVAARADRTVHILDGRLEQGAYVTGAAVGGTLGHGREATGATTASATMNTPAATGVAVPPAPPATPDGALPATGDRPAHAPRPTRIPEV